MRIDTAGRDVAVKAGCGGRAALRTRVICSGALRARTTATESLNIMPETYVGYPNLERISLDRRDHRIPAPRLLQLWYLTQGLPRKVTREQLFAAWAPRGGNRSACRRDLKEGMGRLWRQPRKNIKVYSPEELHQQLRLPWVTVQRHRSTLWLPPVEWRRSLIVDEVCSYQVGPDGKTDPLSNARIAAGLGISSRTVRRHLASVPGLSRVPQYVDKSLTPAEMQARKQKLRGTAHLVHYEGRTLQRLGDAFLLPQALAAAGERRTAQGELLEANSRRRPGAGPCGADLWSDPFEPIEFPPPGEHEE